MSGGADFWRVGYGADFARNIERIAKALERIAAALEQPTKEKK